MQTVLQDVVSDDWPLTLRKSPGRYSWEFWAESQRLGSPNPDLIPDVASKIHTHFQTWFLEPKPVSVKFIPFFRLSDQNGQNPYPILDFSGSKSIPFDAHIPI